MLKIKKCPLCGSDAWLDTGELTHIKAIVCACSSHVFFGCEYDAKKTIEQWNRRAGGFND